MTEHSITSKLADLVNKHKDPEVRRVCNQAMHTIERLEMQSSNIRAKIAELFHLGSEEPR